MTKSTAAKLAARFWDNDKGEITGADKVVVLSDGTIVDRDSRKK